MQLTSLLAAGLFGLAATSVLPASDYEVHERRDAPHHEWIKRDRVPGHDVLAVRIGMTQTNLENGHEMLMEVSDPHSPKYGQHYTAEEVIDIFAPSQESIDAVKEWLYAHGGFAAHRVSLSANKQWMQLDAKAHELEALLRTEYHVYDHHATGKRSVACDKYHLPEHVRRHVDYITPGINLIAIADQPQLQSRDTVVKPQPFSPKFSPLPEPLPEIQNEPEAVKCTKLMTPNCIQSLYSIPPLQTAVAGNTIGVYESFGQTYSQSDLNGFYKNFQPRIPQGTAPKNISIDGGVAKSTGGGGGESTLDLDCIYPIVYPTQVTFYAVDDKYYNSRGSYDGLFNTFLDAIDGSYCNYTAFGITGDSPGGKPPGIVPPLDPPYPDPHRGGYKGQLQCGVYKPTKVISISYSLAEFFTPMNYQRRQCNEFMKLGLQGVSVTMATGDDGVANNKYISPFEDNGCLFSNKSNFPQTGSFKKRVFNPGFPVTCPYVTTVGSTVLTSGGEIATQSFGSAGGFSNIYPIPDYQTSAVTGFFKNHPPPYKYYETTYNKSFSPNGGRYNRAGRGFPDVSAVGDLIAVYESGPGSSGGTSASAPIFGAVLSRLNDARIKAGKSSVGFVNPVLYKNPSILNDITKGNNPGCNTNGFNATTGWDPVTGLGTPNYPAMLKLFMSLP